MSGQPTPFGTLPDGRPASLYHLDNGRGLRATVSDYGALLVDLQTPDRDGNWDSITLGYPDLTGYVDGKWYLGAVCGRFANRISSATFALGDKRHMLSVNDGANHLHGGTVGFDRAVWKVTDVGSDRIVLTLMSPDGDQGYAGNLVVNVTYTLTHDDGLQIDYLALADQPTHVNLTHHAYFNLAAGGDVRGHLLRVDASRYLPAHIAEPGSPLASIPTGELALVKDTPLDLQLPTKLGSVVEADHGQIQVMGGIDHCYVLERDGFELAAVLDDPVSGRRMEVITDQPGLQIYTGNYLDGVLFPRWGGVCLETQHFPDTPNQPHFPTTVLRPGTAYTSRTLYRFKTRAAE